MVTPASKAVANFLMISSLRLDRRDKLYVSSSRLFSSLEKSVPQWPIRVNTQSVLHLFFSTCEKIR